MIRTRIIAIGMFLAALCCMPQRAEAQYPLCTRGVGGSGTIICPQPFALGYIPTGIPALRISAGLVDNTEFDYLDGVTSSIQTQLGARALVSRILATPSGSGLQGGGDLSADRSLSVLLKPGGGLAADAMGLYISAAMGGPHAASHTMGGGDPVSLDASQISSGTFALARLPMLPLNKGGLNRDLTTGLTDGHVLIVTAGAADFGALTATSLPTGIPAAKLGAGIVDNTELGYLDGVTSAIQSQLDSKAPSSRTITAGNGLSGGGTLATDRALAVAADADGSIAVGAGGVKVGMLATDAQHGNRAGGALHALASAMAAGFMSAADFAKLAGITTGATNTPLASTTPAAVGSAAVGVGTTAARADHVHAHGDQAGGTLHADATTMVSGFMPASAVTKLATVATNATATPLASTAPVNATKAAADVGVATTAARADHKHDVSTAAAVDLSTANAEGTSTSLARADHTHRSPILQTVGFTLATDQQTMSSTLADITGATVTFSTQTGTKLVISCSVSASSTSVLGAYIQTVLNIDGSDDIGMTQSFPAIASAAQSGAIARIKTGLMAGSHTVKLRWATTAATTSRIRAATTPQNEHASCMIQESIL